MAVDAALADVDAGRIGLVPPICVTPTIRVRRRSATASLRLPHDEPRGISAQQYLPDELTGARYYRPTDHGAEGAMAERLKRIEGLLGHASTGSLHRQPFHPPRNRARLRRCAVGSSRHAGVCRPPLVQDLGEAACQ